MDAPLNFGTNIFHLIRILISYNLTQFLQHFDGAGDHKANIECGLRFVSRLPTIGWEQQLQRYGLLIIMITFWKGNIRRVFYV